MESSVTSLIDLLNSVETRRRVVMMKRKEAEMRLSFVTEEQQQLQEQSARNQVREAELKKELDHLLEEQRQIQLQLMMGTDAVRQSEIEETLLIGHMRDQLERVEGLLSQWHDHAQTLEDIQKPGTRMAQRHHFSNVSLIWKRRQRTFTAVWNSLSVIYREKNR
ncbi:hypothetical protein ERJ75_000727800 [Trypanosoma vivax]|nr:hypothetical protein ERJ75_000727800 [Trypanosoma vivax]